MKSSRSKLSVSKCAEGLKERWTTQIGGNPPKEDITPKADMSVDPSCGAHFQYKELLKRLSNISNSSKKQSSSSKAQKKKQEQRMPLKEKT